MLAKRIRADYQILKTITQTFKHEAEQLAEVNRRINANVADLEQGDWLGKGANTFYAEMRGQVQPALARLQRALAEAALVTQECNLVMQTAEDEAAKVFRLDGIAADGALLAGAAVIPTPGPVPAPPPTPTPPPDETEAQKLREEIIKLLDDIHKVKNDGEWWDWDNDYYYTIQQLQLDKLSLADLQTLKTYLDTGQLPLNDAVQQIGLLQKYWNYDNGKMISALREMYYPEALDPFIADGDKIDASIHKINGDVALPDGTTLTGNQAALAHALLLLSAQGDKYKDPILKIEFPPEYGLKGEFGLDHVITGLDGATHPLTNGPDGKVWVGLSLLGTDTSKIQSLAAMTWQGDLGATVQIGMQYSDKHKWFWESHSADADNPNYNSNPAAQAGYAKEMPLQDFNGDLFANAIVQKGLFNSSDSNLASILQTAFDPQGEVATQRYQLFADQLNLTYDTSGNLEQASREAFVADNLQPVSDFGQGLYKGALSVFTVDQSFSETLATVSINHFLDEIQSGLQTELDPMHSYPK